MNGVEYDNLCWEVCDDRAYKEISSRYFSPGNCIDLDRAVTIVMNMVGDESHIPIPTREADIDTHKAREEYKLSSGGEYEQIK